MKNLAAIVTLACALLVTGAPALAHAVLLSSDPSSGQRIERAPQIVTLTFDENVESNLGSVRVLDAAGVVRSEGPVAHPDGDGRRVAVHLEPLERGRYVVTWQVVSADSHIVNGAFAFGFGAAAGDAPVVAAANGAALLLPIVHFFLLAAVVIAIGLPIGVVALTGQARRAALPIEFGAWFVVAFAAFTDVAFRADIAGGSLVVAFGTHVGHMRAITIAAGLAGIVALAAKHRRLPLLACACTMTVVSISLGGHAADGNSAAVGVAADALHLLAAATWIGVLAVATTLGAGPRLRRISPFALTAVIVLILTGVVQTLRNAGSLNALVSTPYGYLIDTKITLLCVLLVFAAVARRALRRGIFAIVTGIKTELWLLTAVLAITAVLVESPLPREAAPLATRSSSFSLNGSAIRVTAIRSAGPIWNLAVESTAPLDAIDVSVSERRRNVGPLAVTMRRSGPGQFSGTIGLPFAGQWVISVSARSGPFDEAHHSLPLPETQW